MDSEIRYNQCKDSDIWLLIQLPEAGYSIEIIHSSDVIQKDKMQNGQTIDVRYGDSSLKGEIYATSDNKTFLEHELHFLHLRKAKDILERQINQKPSVYKRRKQLAQSRLESHIEYKPNSYISGLPSPTWSNDTNESMISNVENQTTVVMQPMTFEQGTQYDIKLTSDGESTQLKHISELVHQLDSFILDMWDVNKQIKKELDNNKDSLTNSQIIHYQTNANNEAMVLTHVVNSQNETNNEPIVLFTESSNHLANFNSPQINNSVYDVNDPNISYSRRYRGVSGNMATNELSFNSIPTYQDHEPFSARKENSTKSSFRNKTKSNCTEFVVIGQLGSKASKITIDSLSRSRVKSYSFATRKILKEFFTSEVLATHSLSGRPSPGHPSKPVKNQLNPRIVADIVEFISKRFNVPEIDVRGAITTKCSDEHRAAALQKQNSIK